MSTPSRRLVALALQGVFDRNQRIADEWDRGLGPEDARFAQAILGHCLRKWGRLQAYVKPRLTQSSRLLPVNTQVALAMGLAQLAWMDGVASHAAVSETVGMMADPEVGFQPHQGLVNAILRRAAADRAGLRNDLDALPAVLDRSPFIRRALEGALDPHDAKEDLELLWSRLQTPPRPTFRRLRDEPLPEGLVPDPDLPEAYTLEAGAPFPRVWLSNGAGMVQDRSSQAMLRFDWQAPVHRILDTCAAPGGKSTALALRYPDSQLYAVEVNPKRAERFKKTLVQRGIETQVAEVVVTDAAAWLKGGGAPFDLILVDAPCSASGTLQKHPELTWIGDSLDLKRLVAAQWALIEAAIPRLAKGGLFIYAVCSWLPEECRKHYERAQMEFPEMEPAAVWPDGFGLRPGPSPVFCPHPIQWDGEGFQAFALKRPL
ncbi:MAG TPA: RsmB/NOP family class I SAM-dependent RNA methyltransferase [Holophagaceae bacterium]|nr:RsmB/NOP family class I SAM-dependent RNA methyltransferase [Holophagaceae bacterium]